MKGYSRDDHLLEYPVWTHKKHMARLLRTSKSYKLHLHKELVVTHVMCKLGQRRLEGCRENSLAAIDIIQEYKKQETLSTGIASTPSQRPVFTVINTGNNFQNTSNLCQLQKCIAAETVRHSPTLLK